MLPAVCYVCSDNLAMKILQLVDPATMGLLWNMKILWTALLMRFVLGIRLTKRKALALGLLVVGLLVSKADRILHRAAPENVSDGLVLGLFVACCGTLAVSMGNVSFEGLMKRNDQPYLHWSNLQLYLFGLCFNMCAGLVATGHATVSTAAFEGFNIWCLAIILNYSVAGIVLGAVLKYHDNITVIYCHTVAMVLQTVLQHLVFGFAVTSSFTIGLLIICFSLRLYYGVAESIQDIALPSAEDAKVLSICVHDPITIG